MAVIVWQGTEYDLVDFDKVTMPEWREVKRKSGLTIRQILEGFQQMDPDALTVYFWLTRRTRDDGVVLDMDEEFDVMGFYAVWVAASRAEAEADPTQAGSLPDTPIPDLTGSSTGTSTPSPLSTGSRSRGGATSANGKSRNSPSAVSSPM